MASNKITTILGRISGIALSAILCLILGCYIFLKTSIYQPSGVDEMEIYTLSNDASAETQSNKNLKVLSYNVQYFAGKDYVFFYDMPGFSGPDTRPSPSSISQTMDEVAKIILKTDPDIVLLQEIDEGAKRTDYENQTKRLLSLLKNQYGYYSETFYWKASYVPHPKINGPVGMKLTTLSKAPILSAKRHQLPRIQENWILSHFNFYRAVLETRIQWGKNEIAVMNTHFDAFPDSSDTMSAQVNQVQTIVEALNKESVPWIIGGDFNLLPPDVEGILPSSATNDYSKQTELLPMFQQYGSIPSMTDIKSDKIDDWLTHFPNDPTISSPDRIIDYMFYSKDLKTTAKEVLQGDTWKISDHLPVFGTFEMR